MLRPAPCSMHLQSDSVKAVLIAVQTHRASVQTRPPPRQAPPRMAVRSIERTWPQLQHTQGSTWGAGWQAANAWSVRAGIERAWPQLQHTQGSTWGAGWQAATAWSVWAGIERAWPQLQHTQGSTWGAGWQAANAWSVRAGIERAWPQLQHTQGSTEAAGGSRAPLVSAQKRGVCGQG